MLPYIHLLSLLGSSATHQSQDTVTVTVLLARNAPYILILLVLALAVLYSWMALRQYRVLAYYHRRILNITRTKDAVDSYLAIATHQLNSPVSLMKSAVKLLESVQPAGDEKIKDLQLAVNKFEDAVAGLLVANRVSNAQTSRKDKDITTNAPGLFRARMVWVPALVSLASLALINGLSVYTDLFNRSAVNMVIEFGVFLVAISMVAFAYRYRSMLQRATLDMQKQLSVEADLYTARSAFISQASTVIDSHYDLLKVASQPLHGVSEAKIFFKGLKVIAAANEGLARVERFVVRGPSPLFDLATFVRKTAAEAQALTANQHITFDVDIADGIALRIQPEEVRYVVRAIIDNAVKFSEQESQITVRLAKRGGKIAFEVEDRGAGISSQRLPTLLKPFAQGTDPAQLSFATMGLSLYVVKIIVAKHGGELTIKSRLGEGTTVVVVLPYNTGITRGRAATHQEVK